mmetsp:Transcript_24037/g.71361  ORF Transcript_24037/g.71361 Transcript_24037/m.71361 type:complete len:108 (-) Transcript_24037:139-462(-)
MFVSHVPHTPSELDALRPMHPPRHLHTAPSINSCVLFTTVGSCQRCRSCVQGRVKVDNPSEPHACSHRGKLHNVQATGLMSMSNDEAKNQDFGRPATVSAAGTVGDV